MSHDKIDQDWFIQRSTPLFNVHNVPEALLTRHNTAAGVWGQLCVMHGTVTYYGFVDEKAPEPEMKKIIPAGTFALSPPQYWHRVELSDDALFNLNFWSKPTP